MLLQVRSKMHGYTIIQRMRKMGVFLKKLLSTFLITLLLLYAGYVLIGQEKQIRDLKIEQEKYASFIDEASLKTEELQEIKNKVNSDEYIEQYAREKLGLVMPYETIYVDASL